MILSIIVSIIFIFTQFVGFSKLSEIGMPLAGNASGSFVYVIVLAHALHIVGGLFFSFIILAKSYLPSSKLETKNNIINPKRLLSLELLTIYWHFIDFIWIYLFIFFYFNYQ